MDSLPYYKRIDLNNEHKEAEVQKILEELAHEINASVARCNWCLEDFGCECDRSAPALCIFIEVEDTGEQRVVYHSAIGNGPLNGMPVTAPYPPLAVLDQKRLLARKSNTTYCYDFPLAFEAALEKSWASHNPRTEKPKDKVLLKVTELSFADKKASGGTPLVSVERQPGFNDVGMVAWIMEMSTPEFPMGRKILVVANDVTFRNGSFGPSEDAFFQAVTDVACEQKMPLIYLAPGARIGAAEEYVYLTPEDHERIKSSVLAHELKLSNGEIRWVIDTIIGKEDGLGVENLSGSGAIASAYSRAYHETFTLTYVTGRTVGIGAYLARLGMRCIQRLDQPIILTDASGKWLGGIFDKDSFIETLEGWARTVVTGRAKLGGGQRDLFEGILQAGSTIVENLRTYKQPVFVYIPMMGELRGGAWVVVDSKINSDHIEMYAERTARGNVLEPEDAVEGVRRDEKSKQRNAAKATPTKVF
ncbi:Acetyl-CoA Carboxylase [Datura stramonium]|uniref:Acetyl-CoA Carboxylase n=1 Tax=Datura stramonium TaxID=4076 RepID=A0ABS8WM90_DATST|nr:Acetyl-CoA Carboxylase [Datura stramonium]